MFHSFYGLLILKCAFLASYLYEEHHPNDISLVFVKVNDILNHDGFNSDSIKDSNYKIFQNTYKTQNLIIQSQTTPKPLHEMNQCLNYLHDEVRSRYVFFTSYGVNTLAVFHFKKYSESELYSVIQNINQVINQNSGNANKINIKVHFSQTQWADLLRTVRNFWNSRRNSEVYDGNFRSLNSQNAIDIINGFLNWRETPLAKEEYSYKSQIIKSYDYFELENNSSAYLEPGKDHFIILHSYNEFNSIKVEKFWRRIAIEVATMIPNITIGEVEMSRATLEGIWPYPTPQWRLYSQYSNLSSYEWFDGEISREVMLQFLEQHSYSYRSFYQIPDEIRYEDDDYDQEYLKNNEVPNLDTSFESNTYNKQIVQDESQNSPEQPFSEDEYFMMQEHEYFLSLPSQKDQDLMIEFMEQDLRYKFLNYDWSRYQEYLDYKVQQDIQSKESEEYQVQEYQEREKQAKKVYYILKDLLRTKGQEIDLENMNETDVLFLEDAYKEYQETHCVDNFKDIDYVYYFFSVSSKNYDMDEMIEEDVKARSDLLLGYEISEFDYLGYHKIGQPFYRIFSRVHRQDVGVVLIGAPLYDDDYQKYYMIKAAGYMPVGIMSYRSWPKYMDEEAYTDLRIENINQELYDLVGEFAGWLHCARNPSDYLGNFQPRINFAESDLSWDVIQAWYPGEEVDQEFKKEFDLVYVNLGDSDWHNATKNWPLALESFYELTKELDLKILIIGRDPPEDLRMNIVVKPFMDFEQVLQHFGRSKAIFIPSVSDASPRVMTQALSLNVPVLVNYNIVGGWKYVNNQTGVYFTSHLDVVDAYKRLMELGNSGQLQPRKWYEEYATMSAKKLQSFIQYLKVDYVHNTPYIHPDDYPYEFKEDIYEDQEQFDQQKHENEESHSGQQDYENTHNDRREDISTDYINIDISLEDINKADL
eukprot:403356617